MYDDEEHMIHRFENLLGIPSAHFEPMFAKSARHALRYHSPSVLALESSTVAADEWRWAADCWPLPVVSQAGDWFLPFVPGDSMLEAYMAARTFGIPIAFIDPWLEAPTPAPTASPAQPSPVGGELAPLLRSHFTRLPAFTHHVTDRDLAREAFMARQLRDLMRRHARVLWIGGAAHWERIVDRLRRGDFTAPRMRKAKVQSFTRMQLSRSAMVAMTGRLPWTVRGFVERGKTYDEDSSLRALALRATQPHHTSDDITLTPEPAGPTDVARVLMYARNLAMARGLRQRPTFHELLTSATAVIGPSYAGVLHLTAMDDGHEPLSSDTGSDLPVLTWDADAPKPAFRCGHRWVAADSIWPRSGDGLPPVTVETVVRRARHEQYRDLPPAHEWEEERAWRVHPDDGRDYIAFVETVLRQASQRDPEQTAVEPFLTGTGDGLDVRATIRSMAQKHNHIHIRRGGAERLRFTNGVIDWRNDSEHTDFLQGKAGGGWIDPDFTCIGSASRERGHGVVLQEHPYHLQRDQRDFTLISLDLPTMTREGPSFYDKVILPLLPQVGGLCDTVYTWLDIMFAFCAGKPFAYFSRYVPSPRIHTLAARHGVTVVHIPLQSIPEALRDRNRVFRYIALSRSQWEALRERLGEG